MLEILYVGVCLLVMGAQRNVTLIQSSHQTIYSWTVPSKVEKRLHAWTQKIVVMFDLHDKGAQT